MTRQQVYNADLKPDTARNNLLTNGGFEIWQRGNGPFTTGFTADRWQVAALTGGTVSITRIASTTGSTGFSAQVVYGHAASQLLQYAQTIEDPNGQLAGKTITFSARIKSSVIGTARLKLQDKTIANSAVSGYNVGTSGETLTVTFTMPSNAVNGVWAMLECNVASATVEINDATLVVGSVAADYVQLHPADVLVRCLRYYEKVVGAVRIQAVGAGQCGWCPLSFGTLKATTPTATFGATDNTGNVTSTQIITVYTHGASLQAVSTAAGDMYWNGTTIFEANP